MADRGTDQPDEERDPALAVTSGEQTLADLEQTLADADQTASDADQTAADTDQDASDRDQAASVQAVARGDDPGAYALAFDLRARSIRQRREAALRRLEVAAARDANAAARDQAATLRDLATEQRGRDLAAHEALGDVPPAAAGGAGMRAHAIESRERAAADRTAAAEARARAAANRLAAGADRTRAARDRAEAHAAREASSPAPVGPDTDPLTGAWVREIGLELLEVELARARRTSRPLVAAYLDFGAATSTDGGSESSETPEGARRTVEALRARSRPYDAIVHVTDGALVWVVPGVALADVERRLDGVRSSLATGPDPCEVRVGLAALKPGDSGAGLIDRAAAGCPGRRPG